MQQENGKDCGAFALAFLVDIAFGWNPEDRSYDIHKLRAHLVKCLSANKFTEFPQAPPKRRIKRCKAEKFSKDIFCICRQAYYGLHEENEKYFMIECHKCKEWYHKGCLHIPKKFFQDKAELFCCSRCKT